VVEDTLEVGVVTPEVAQVMDVEEEDTEDGPEEAVDIAEEEEVRIILDIFSKFKVFIFFSPIYVIISVTSSFTNDVFVNYPSNLIASL
jgi:hypothetical protein